MMQQQPMMSPQGRPPQGAPRQGIAQLNPNVPMQTQLNQLSKLPPQQLEARKNESFLAAIAAEQQAAKAEAAQREKLMLENPELATDEKIIDRLRQSTIASMMPPTNPMPSVMDKAEGVAGVLQNKTAKRKRSMNKLASAGLPATGKPPMKSMASGGILGYKTGTEVINDEGSRLERALKALGITYKDYMALSPTAKEDLQPKLNQEYAKQKKEFTPEFGAIGPILQSMDEVKERTEALIASGLTPEEATSEERRRRLNPTDAEKQSSASASVTSVDSNKSMSGLPSVGAFTKELQKMQGPDPEQKPGVGVLAPGQVAVPGQGVLRPPVVPPAAPAAALAAPAGATAGTTTGVPTIEQMMQKDYTKNVEDDQLSEALGDDLLKGIKDRANVNPMDQQMGEEVRLDARFNPEDRIGKLGERQQKRMQDYLTERESPERQAYLKRLAMYNSMGKGGLGSIVGGMNRGLQNYELAQDKGKSSGLGALTALEDTDITRKTNVLKDSTSAAATLGDRIAQQQDSAVSAQINVSTIDLNAAKQDVKNAFDRDVQIAGMSAKQYANELSADMNLLIKEANNVQALAAIQRQLNDAVAKSAEALSNQFNSSRILKAENELDNAEKERLNKGEPPETDNGRLIAKYNATKKALNEQMGLDTLRATIEKKQKDLSGSAMLSPAQQAALDRI